MIKNILWILVGINTLALLIFIGAYLFYSQKSSSQDSVLERDWTAFILIAGLLVILAAALPLRFGGHSNGWIVFAGVFALVPLLIVALIYVPDFISSFKQQETMAETYYKDKTQRSIATAIQKNDTTLLKQLIKGQDLNIQGTRVWDWDGLNYLQFAIRLRSNPEISHFNKEVNLAVMQILIANGSVTTPALAEATSYLSNDEILLLLNSGANPNCVGLLGKDPLLFQVIGKQQNEIAKLLIQKGADINALNDDKITPVMFASFSGGTSEYRKNLWSLVRYLLEEAHADYAYTRQDGANLTSFLKGINEDAIEKKINMPPDFYIVMKWLEAKNVNAFSPN